MARLDSCFREALKVMAFIGLVLIALAAVPAAPAFGSSGPGIFARTIDAGGLTLNITAVYAKNWTWDQNNTVHVTIGRASGADNATVMMLDESAALHLNGSDFLLATARVAPVLTGHSRVDLTKPIDLNFTFSSARYTYNAQQGSAYPAHIAVGVGMSIASNGTDTAVSFTDGPGNMLVTLNTEKPIARAQVDWPLLAATEALGFAGILFMMKAAKIGDRHGK